MDLAHDTVSQDIEGFRASVKPSQPFDDILAFQFASVGDVPDFQAKHLIWRERSGAGGFGRFQGHFQRYLGISCAISFASSSIISSWLRRLSDCPFRAIYIHVCWLMRRAFLTGVMTRFSIAPLAG